MDSLVFKSSSELSSFRNRIEELVQVKQTDSIISHARAIVRMKQKQASFVYGDVSDSRFSLWKYNTPAGGLFCSILQGEIYNKGEHLLVKLDYKMNPLGHIFTLLLLLIVAFILSFSMLMKDDTDIDIGLIALSVYTVLAAISYSLFFHLWKKSGRKFFEEYSRHLYRP